MFEKLIESSSSTKDKKDRSSYFAVSTFLMSAALIAGFLVSIFGANFDIGNADLEISQLLAPVETNAPEPRKESASQPEQQASTSRLPMRTQAVQQITETPNKIVPVATAPVDFKARPDGQFEIGPLNIDPPNSGSTGNGSSNVGSSVPNGSGAGNNSEGDVAKTLPPPPVIEKPKVNPNTVVSLGAVNGRAIDLPKPPYPQTARAVRAEGAVQVQITIDKDGSVISAKAIGGHPTLRIAAENAAKRAKFSPTKLSNVPVKATGVITYNFKLG